MGQAVSAKSFVKSLQFQLLAFTPLTMMGGRGETWRKFQSGSWRYRAAATTGLFSQAINRQRLARQARSEKTYEASPTLLPRSTRPGISKEMATQSLSSCAGTASFNLLSSAAVHLPTRTVVGSMLETNNGFCHLLRPCTFVRPGASAAIVSQSVPAGQLR
jgi:hypothetical protein